ncbi:MAG TPA: hypothetical protein VEY30_02500 [Myxococcaceae bacterium]|nr:hypothetical protein [Myxococcaceae bacterium]
MGEKFSRFRRLERTRGEGAKSEPAPTTPSRFGRVRVPPAPVENGGTAERGHSPGRFAAPPDDGAVAVRERLPGEQPFIRCARCEADNSIYVQACINCDAALDSPEQRAFNERLWRARQAQTMEETQALQALRREREAQQTQAASAARREWAERTAERVRREVERELEGANGEWREWARRAGYWWRRFISG